MPRGSPSRRRPGATPGLALRRRHRRRSCAPGSAELWRQGARRYLSRAPAPEALPGMMGRVLGGVFHLRDHLHEVPVHVIPCIEGRTDGKRRRSPRPRAGARSSRRSGASCSRRARAGSGPSGRRSTSRTSEEAAELLGIPYAEVMQAALIPVAYTLGTEFKPGCGRRWSRWCTGTPGEARGFHARRRLCPVTLHGVSGRGPAADHVIGGCACPLAKPTVGGDEPVGPPGRGQVLRVARDPVVRAFPARAHDLHEQARVGRGRLTVEDDERRRSGRLGPRADQLDELLLADVRPGRPADVLGIDERYRFHELSRCSGRTVNSSTSGRW